MRPTRVILTFTIVALTGGCASAPSAETHAPGSGAVSEPVPEPGPPGDPTAPPTVGATGGGLYTEAQAERGRAAFRSVCAECHYSSEFRGTQFQFEWRRRTVWDFFREVSRTMPEDAPGSLEAQEYVDIVTYVLRSNGFPPGQRELVPEESIMDAHAMAAPGPGAD